MLKECTKFTVTVLNINTYLLNLVDYHMWSTL